MEERDSFFGKNGTLQNLVNFSDQLKDGIAKGYQDLQSMRSDSSMERLGTIVKIVGSIVAMCA